MRNNHTQTEDENDFNERLERRLKTEPSGSLTRYEVTVRDEDGRRVVQHAWQLRNDGTWGRCFRGRQPRGCYKESRVMADLEFWMEAGFAVRKTATLN